MTTNLLFAAGRTALSAAVATVSMSFAAHARQTEHTFKKNVEVQMDYLHYLPADYETPEAAERYPLVVFLRGGGAADLTEVGEQLLSTLNNKGAGYSQADDLAFSDPKLYDWLLQQTRVAPENYTPTAKSTDTFIEPAQVLE